MSVFVDLFKILRDSGLLTAAFIIGAIALFVAIVGNIQTIIELSPSRALVLASFGMVLMGLSVGGYFITIQTTPTPTEVAAKVSTPVAVASSTVVATTAPQSTTQPIITIQPQTTQAPVTFVPTSAPLATATRVVNVVTATSPPATVVPTLIPTIPPSSLCPSYYAFGKCWQYDETTRTMTWTGPTDGREDIWQGDEVSLNRIRGGWTAIFGPVTVPGEIEACVLNLNGQLVVNSCDSIQHPYPVAANNTYRVTSQNPTIGGFRWKPAKGYGYRKGES